MDSLYIKDNVDLYVTGSNAKLSQPINFKEVYNRYIQYGSLPYVLELDEDEEIIRGYLEGVFNTAVLKDIVARKKIDDVIDFIAISQKEPLYYQAVKDKETLECELRPLRAVKDGTICHLSGQENLVPVLIDS